MSSESIISAILAEADIQVGGTRPWDIAVHDRRMYDQILGRGSLGAGESYMNGWWDAPKLDELFKKIGRANLESKVHSSFSVRVRLGLFTLGAILQNRQSIARAFQVAEKHYNIGNDLYRKMLDPWMQYSCGYWDNGAQTLNESQEAKLDLIARKLKLTPGMRVLDVGCGWGGLAKYLAEKHGVHVLGITVSEEQAKFAKVWTVGLPVEIQIADYRTLKETQFDRIVSVGMFEHVGYKNYRTYMEHIARLLNDDGIFLLHTIGRNSTALTADPWIDKYIFPNGLLPSPEQMGTALTGTFVLEDWHNFGPSYDKTLMAWFHNFDRAWGTLSATGAYDDRFYRMWKYYLLMCAGAFRARTANLWQLVLTKNGIAEGYTSVR